MIIADRVAAVITDHRQTQSHAEELVRLQEFLCRMKEAGVAKTREYDLPQPDTVGRSGVEKFQNRPIQF